MYNIYHTNGFVLGTANHSEADKVLSIFSEDFGLIKATAQGMRELKSKLRYGLQLYCFSRVSLVKTKNGWRVTGASLIRNVFFDFRADKGRLEVVAKMVSLLRRLLHGEEKNANLFATFLSGLDFLSRCDRSGLADLEAIIVLRILNHLGYIGDSPVLSKFLGTTEWTDYLVRQAKSLKREVVTTINNSLEASHL